MGRARDGEGREGEKGQGMWARSTHETRKARYRRQYHGRVACPQAPPHGEPLSTETRSGLAAAVQAAATETEAETMATVAAETPAVVSRERIVHLARPCTFPPGPCPILPPSPLPLPLRPTPAYRQEWPRQVNGPRHAPLPSIPPHASRRDGQCSAQSRGRGEVEGWEWWDRARGEQARERQWRGAREGVGGGGAGWQGRDGGGFGAVGLHWDDPRWGETCKRPLAPLHSRFSGNEGCQLLSATQHADHQPATACGTGDGVESIV